MKTILLACLASSSAFAATQTINLTVTPTVVDSSLCRYEAKLPFKQFPDFEVFTSTADGKTWQKGTSTVRATVETDENTYTLRLQPASAFVENNQPCPTKNLKVLIRE